MSAPTFWQEYGPASINHVALPLIHRDLRGCSLTRVAASRSYLSHVRRTATKTAPPRRNVM